MGAEGMPNESQTALAQSATALARVAADFEGVAGRAAREAMRAREAGAEPNHVTALDRAANEAAGVASRLRQAQLDLPQQRLFDAAPGADESLSRSLFDDTGE